MSNVVKQLGSVVATVLRSIIGEKPSSALVERIYTSRKDAKPLPAFTLLSRRRKLIQDVFGNAAIVVDQQIEQQDSLARVAIRPIAIRGEQGG